MIYQAYALTEKAAVVTDIFHVFSHFPETASAFI